jgi:hypothetical protein
VALDLSAEAQALIARYVGPFGSWWQAEHFDVNPGFCPFPSTVEIDGKNGWLSELSAAQAFIVTPAAPDPGETCEVKIGLPWLETIKTRGRVVASTSVGEATRGQDFYRSLWRYDLHFEPGQPDDKKLRAHIDAARGVENWER